MVEEDEEPDIPWGDSKAKGLLEDDLKNGVIPLESGEGMTVKDIWQQRVEFTEYHLDKFGGRLATARKRVSLKVKRRDQDQEAFEAYARNHERSLVDAKGEPQWDTSDAQKQLREDMSADLHTTLTTTQLYESQQVYQDYSFATFTSKIVQETRKRKYDYQMEEKKVDKKADRLATNIKKKNMIRKKKETDKSNLVAAREEWEQERSAKENRDVD